MFWFRNRNTTTTGGRSRTLSPNSAWWGCLPLQGPDAPAEGGLVFHTRIQRDAVLRGGAQAGGVVDGHLGHAGDGVIPGAEGPGEGDGVTGFQSVDLAKVVAHTSVVVE